MNGSEKLAYIFSSFSLLELIEFQQEFNPNCSHCPPLHCCYLWKRTGSN